MSIFELWFISFIPNLIKIFIFLIFVSTLFGFILLLKKHPYDPENIKISWLLKAFSPVFIFFTLACIVPDKESMKLILGGYVVTNSENIEKLPDNIIKFSNAYLEDQIDKIEDRTDKRSVENND